ncbi:MAG: C40 family peptidase [Bacteriovoracaceae bacterium]|nr:C40 family peptidase [Bacteriovoracaceae bacterium]
MLSVLISLSCFATESKPWLWPEDQERMNDYASMFEGSPYSYGARKPSSEDCSSFIQKIFTVVGIELPRSSREQAQDDRFIEVKKSEIKAGDLVFFRNTYRKGISHVAYMIDPTTMIHASRSGKSVARDQLDSRHPLWKKIHSVKRWRNIMDSEEAKPKFSWDDKI